jgi:cytochrome c oxidase cbb3-type subunit 3
MKVWSLLAALLLLATAAAWGFYQHQLGTRLVSAYADNVPQDHALRDYALSLAKPAFAEHCAGCHGADRAGDPARGVPDLRHGAWLYDFGRVSDIERTILYGIRSGHAKGRNTTDMPALGVTKAINPDEIRDVVAYVVSLSRAGGDAAAIARGERIYQGKGQCFDCHGADASGNIDWGVPAFTTGSFIYGGTPDTIYTSIHDGRHGRCPAWISVLDFATIRALAVMLHEQPRQGTQS